MNIRSATARREDNGSIAVEVVFDDGRRAEIFEPKLSLVHQHIVALLPVDSHPVDWEAEVSARAIDESNLDHIDLPGCVQDLRLAWLAAQLHLGTIEPGPVEVPAEDDIPWNFTKTLDDI